MTASKLVLEVTDRSIAHHIGGILTDLYKPAPDAVTVFEDGAGWRVDAYYSGSPPDPAHAAQAVADILEIDRPDCRLLAVPDENWVARSQAALPPVHAGRFIVHGSHDRTWVGRGVTRLQIDAGEAFGTAHHATTYGCLLALDRLARVRRYRCVLDLGTGSGVLALALQRLQPQARILATDLDARSIEVARENAAQNALTGTRDRRLIFLCADGPDASEVRARAPYDLVIANILAGPLMAFAGALARNTRPGSDILLSGILDRQARDVMGCYGAHGFHVVRHDRYEGWSTLSLRRA